MGECTTDNDWKLTVGGKVQLPPIEGISVGGGIDNETSESIKVVNKATLDVVNEAVRRATARVKATRQTKVTESQEIGRESRVTRKLKNSNLCRSAIYDYFEVLASYEVKTVPLPDQIRLAVLVPNPFPEKVDRNFLIVNEGALRAALLDAKQEPGFLAARMLIAREHYCVLKCSQECKCPEPAKSSPASPSPQGATTGQPTPSVAGVEDPVTRARNRVMTADTTVRACINAIAAADTQNLATAYDRNATQSVKETAIREFRQYMLRTFGLEMFQASWWGECLAFTSSSASPERLERLLAAADGVWLETLIRGFFIGGLLAQFTIPFLVGKLIVKLGIKSGWYAQFIGFDDAGLGAAIGQARTELRLWRNAVSAQIVTTSAQPNQSITTAPEAKKEVEEVAETAEPDPFPLQSVAQWKVDEQALLMHMRNNISHYRRAIWEKMDPADRLNMLQLYGPLPNFVDNEVLGFVGDKVAVPFRTWVVGGLREVMAEVVERLKQVVPEQAREVNIPTNGLHMESRLGTCDTCEEFIMKHRELDLQQKAAEVKAAEERAKQETLETERYQKRLQKKPPELDDPDPNQGQGEIRLLVKQEKQS